MNKNDLGALTMGATLLFLGALGIFFGVGTDAIQEPVVLEASSNMHPTPIPQARNADLKPECFSTDAKQPFKFLMCYIPGKSYRETSVEVVFPKEVPAIRELVLRDETRGPVLVHETFGATAKKRTAGDRHSFELAKIFDFGELDTNPTQLKLRITVTSVGGVESTVVGTLKFAK